MGERLEVVQGRSKVLLRVQLSRVDRAGAAMDLPTEALTVAGRDPRTLWLAPDQWLITSDAFSANAMLANCRHRLAGIVHSATDASAALTAFRLVDPCARALLAMGSGLDFDDFSPGQCARTRLAQIPLVIAPLSRTALDLYVDSSYAAYLSQWISLAAGDPLCADES